MILIGHAFAIFTDLSLNDSLTDLIQIPFFDSELSSVAFPSFLDILHKIGSIS